MEFGDLYSVILTGLPLIKEALVHQDQHFIDRPVTAIRKRVFKKHGKRLDHSKMCLFGILTVCLMVPL